MKRLNQLPNRSVLFGTSIAILAAMSYGCSQVIGRGLIVLSLPPLAISFLSVVAGIGFFSVSGLQSLKLDRKAPYKAFIFMALAGACGSAASAITFIALKSAPVATISPVVGASPLISVLLVHCFLKRFERVTFRLWVGAIMVVAGVILITLSNI